MVTASAPRRGNGAGRIAAWSALCGFLIALAVAAITGRIRLDEQASDATKLGALGFTVAFVAPFAAALAAFLDHRMAMRRAVWLAAGTLAMIPAALTIFSGVGWLFGVAGGGLLLGWWKSQGSSGAFGPARSVILTVWLILWLGGALWTLWLRETPACWNATNGIGWIAATTPTECASDIIDDTEGLLALTGVAIGIAGMLLIPRGGSAARGVARASAPARPAMPD